MKTLIKILGVLVIAGVVIAVGALLPAHLQVRKYGGTPLPDDSALEALRVENGPTALYYLVTSSQKMPVGTLSHTVFLVEWADGRLFMIDAGMTAERAIEFGRLLETALDADETIARGNVAELLGDAADRVSAVGFTHLHIDHTQGIQVFCDAKKTATLLFQSVPQSSAFNSVTQEGADIVARSCLQVKVLPGEGILHPAGFPGLGMFPAGGHTPGSTFYFLWLADKLIILSGDTTNTKRDIIDDRGKGFVYSYLLVPEDTGRTAELRQWLRASDLREDTTVIVSHDLGDIEASGIPEFKP